MSVGFKETTVEIIQLPKELPPGMPRVIDDCSLAHRLGFRNKTLWGVLIDTSRQYEVFKIPKRSSGFREIHAPTPMMKLLLANVHVKFLLPMHYRLGEHVTAYRKNLSVRDAVVQHIPKCPLCDNTEKGVTLKKHVCPKRGLHLKMDLKDFFHTHTRAWIRNYFKDLGYSHTVAAMLAGLLVVQDVKNKAYVPDQEGSQEWYTRTPQGSPASGAICNLVADKRLDQPILEYLETLNKQYGLSGEWRWRYTRYSDDLSISCGVTPPKEARKEILRNLGCIIQSSGYKVNKKKTRVVHGYHRKQMLGIVFNDKPNYAKRDYLRFRAITHNCAVHGFKSQMPGTKQKSTNALILWLRGHINWINQINPAKGAKLLTKFNVAMTMHLKG